MLYTRSFKGTSKLVFLCIIPIKNAIDYVLRNLHMKTQCSCQLTFSVLGLQDFKMSLRFSTKMWSSQCTVCRVVYRSERVCCWRDGGVSLFWGVQINWKPIYHVLANKIVVCLGTNLSRLVCSRTIVYFSAFWKFHSVNSQNFYQSSEFTWWFS